MPGRQGLFGRPEHLRENKNSRFALDEEFTLEEKKQRHKEDVEYFNKMEEEYMEPVKQMAKEYTESEYGKLQIELMALIRAKVDNGDRQRA